MLDGHHDAEGHTYDVADPDRITARDQWSMRRIVTVTRPDGTARRLLLEVHDMHDQGPTRAIAPRRVSGSAADTLVPGDVIRHYSTEDDSIHATIRAIEADGLDMLTITLQVGAGETLFDILFDRRDRVEVITRSTLTGSRSTVAEGALVGRHGAASVFWKRVIDGTMYRFERVIMPDGERRYIAYRFNGYAGGPRFGCAWEQAHFITVKAGS